MVIVDSKGKGSNSFRIRAASLLRENFGKEREKKDATTRKVEKLISRLHSEDSQQIFVFSPFAFFSIALRKMQMLVPREIFKSDNHAGK